MKILVKYIYFKSKFEPYLGTIRSNNMIIFPPNKNENHDEFLNKVYHTMHFNGNPIYQVCLRIRMFIFTESGGF